MIARSGKTAIETSNLILGRKEWVALPELGLSAIKAKVDTGAKTSALHARAIEPFGEGTQLRVRFLVHPIPLRPRIELMCEAAVKDIREVASSNGEKELRYIIETSLELAGRTWPIELGLTNREAMTHRLLIGRQALPSEVLVDPSEAFRLPRLSASIYKQGQVRRR